MKKKTHQILFGLIIINLILILLIVPLTTFEVIVFSFSLLAMLLLPFGKKGGIYHVTLSTIGLVLFVSGVF